MLTWRRITNPSAGIAGIAGIADIADIADIAGATREQEGGSICMVPHTLYLATIAVLILIIAFTAVKVTRMHRLLTEVEEKVGSVFRASAPRPGGANLRALSEADLLRARTLTEYRQEIDGLIEQAAAMKEFGESTQLASACSKALVGGKRLRATIILEVVRASALARSNVVDAAEAALFIEYLHAASLVIDDLPAFDNDLVRRHRPSLHVEVGPAAAQMAALALVAAAFQNLCRQLDWIRVNCPKISNVDRIGMQICAMAARTIGAAGACGGQLLEMTPGDWPSGANVPEMVAELKTASLFELAVGVGWAVAGGDALHLEQMTAIGRHLGIAFQIADDIGDAVKDAAKETPERPATNYALRHGHTTARADLDRNLRAAEALLRRERLWTPLWEDDLYSAIRAMCTPPGEQSLLRDVAPEPAQRRIGGAEGAHKAGVWGNDGADTPQVGEGRIKAEAANSHKV